MSAGFEEIEHTADIAIRAWGDDLASLFASAAYGMACQLTEMSTVQISRSMPIVLAAVDAEALLVKFLNELLFHCEQEHVVFARFCPLEVSETEVATRAHGGVPSVRRAHIKAVTFSDLKIVRIGGQLEATIVFDV